MAQSQSAELILKMVIQVEEEGAHFYQKMARMAPNAAVKEIFLSLADDEVRHKKELMDIFLTLDEKGRILDSSVDLIGLMRGVLDTLKKTMKGSEPVDMEVLNFSTALHIGIENEKVAVHAYSLMNGLFSSSMRSILDKILCEERGHLERLLKIKAERLS